MKTPADIRVYAQIVTIAILLSTALYLQAAPSTAFVSLCCNAPSTAEVFNAPALAPARTLATGSGGDGIALSPDGTKMFVTVDYKSEMEAIATATGAILATVPIPLTISGTPPLEIAIGPDGARVYVFAPQARPSPLLLAIDTTTYQVTQTAAVPFGSSVGALLVSPDGSQLYYEVGYSDEYIQVMDAITLAPLKQIPYSGYASDFAITPSGLLLTTNTSNQLLVIDPATSSVTVWPLPNDNQGTPGIVVSSPDSTTAYISFPVDSILAVNIATGATVFNVPVDYIATNFAVSPDGSTLYSANRSMAGAWSLAEFQISTQKVITAIRQLGPISGFALTRDGHSLYVLNANESAIASVDVATEKLTHLTLGGVDIGTLAIPPGGGALWASQFSFGQGGDILFLNPLTEKLQYKVGYSGAISFSPNGSVAYLTNPGAVAAFDLPSFTRIGTAYVGQLTNIGQAILSPDGARMYISASFVSGISNGEAELAPGEILVLDTNTFKYTAAISVPDGMGEMALSPDGSTLVYTANYGRVHLLSTATHKITATIHLTPANGLLNGLALSPDGATAYVADAENNLLLVANLVTDTQQATVAVGESPSPVVVSPDGSEAWVATLAGLEIVNTTTFEVSSVRLPGEASAILFAP